MPKFRYYFLDDSGAIVSGDYSESSDLQTMIEHCGSIVRQKNLSRIRRIEIWDRDTLVHQTTDIANQEEASVGRSAALQPSSGLAEEYLALMEEARRLAQIISDPAISARLTELATESDTNAEPTPRICKWC
jgi:hypothetical protein